jgi:predicted nucleotidyltransferase
MNVSLTPELEKYVRRKVASGLYNNASEVVREALRFLVDREPVAGKKRPSESPRKEEILVMLGSLTNDLRDRGIASLALFGSVARGVARAGSDVDLLIDIAPDVEFGLTDLISVKKYIEQRIGYRVDIVTREGLDAFVRDDVLDEAEKVF